MSIDMLREMTLFSGLVMLISCGKSHDAKNGVTHASKELEQGEEARMGVAQTNSSSMARDDDETSPAASDDKLVVKIEAVSRLAGELVLTIKLLNESSECLTVLTADKDVPFSIELFDVSGRDLNAQINQKKTPKRSATNRTLELEGRGEKAFEYRQRTYLDNTNQEKPIPRGSYTIKAIFPWVIAEEGGVSVKLLESNEINVEIDR